MFRAISCLAIIVIAYNVIAPLTGPALRAPAMSAMRPEPLGRSPPAICWSSLPSACYFSRSSRRAWRAGVQPPATAAVLIALALLIGMAPPASAQRSGADLPADAKQRLETLLEELERHPAAYARLR